MKQLILLSFFMSSTAIADHSLNCRVDFNLQTVVEKSVRLPKDARNFSFATYNEFEFFLTDTGKNIELQIFNPAEPSRSYAIADFNKTSEVDLTLWKRDFLLSTKCMSAK